MKTRCCALLALLATLLVPASVPAGAAEPIHKWVDANGKVHFGDRPPEGVATEKVDVKDTNVQESVHLQAPPPSGDTAASAPGGPFLSRDEEEARAREFAENCAAARRDVAVLTQRMPVYRAEDGSLQAAWENDTYRGARRYIEEPERAAELQRADDAIDTWCEQPGSGAAQAEATDAMLQEEFCEAARAQLANIQADKRRTRDAIESQQREVDRHCGP
jgi:hypothetical protein